MCPIGDQFSVKLGKLCSPLKLQISRKIIPRSASLHIALSQLEVEIHLEIHDDWGYPRFRRPQIDPANNTCQHLQPFGFRRKTRGFNRTELFPGPIIKAVPAAIPIGLRAFGSSSHRRMTAPNCPPSIDGLNNSPPATRRCRVDDEWRIGGRPQKCQALGPFSAGNHN